MSESKNAVVVGRVTLPQKREVVVQKAQPQQPRRGGPQRRERPVDPRVVSSQQIQELAAVKGELAKAKLQLKDLGQVRYAASELLRVLEADYGDPGELALAQDILADALRG